MAGSRSWLGLGSIILNLSCLPLQTRLTRQDSIGDFVLITTVAMSQAYLEGGTIIKSSPYRCGLWFVLSRLVLPYLLLSRLALPCFVVSYLVAFCLVVSCLDLLVYGSRCHYCSFLFWWSCAGAEDLVSSGRQCVPVKEVDGDLSKCAEHCHDVFSSGKDKTLLASATIDPVFGECCCYSEADCACKGQVAGIPVPADVMMLPGFTLPKEICPSSRVEGGWVRDSDVCVQRATPSVLVFALVWHDLSLSNRTQFCRRMPPVSILQQTKSAALLRLLG